MKRIYRFELKLHCAETYDNMLRIVISTPYQLVKCIKVDVIRNTPSAWFIIDDEGASSKAEIFIVGTGWSIDNSIQVNDYIGSFILEDYGEIYHCFLKM